MRAWRKKRTDGATHVDAFSFAPPPFAAPAPPPGAPPALEATLVEIPEARATGNDPTPEPAPTAAGVETRVEANIETDAGAAAAADPLAMQSEFLRLLAVVTSMCDHVIEYIEADRAERRAMIDTLTQLSRVISAGAATGGTGSAPFVEMPAGPALAREHVIGGSMPVGPEPVVDLRPSEPEFEPAPDRPLALVADIADIALGIEPEIHLGIEIETEIESGVGTEAEIEVEVRGRFGDRWVDGFEICEVLTTPDGPRYRLRRHRDGVVLPELFDATSIRHIETFEQLRGDQLNGSQGYWSRS